MKNIYVLEDDDDIRYIVNYLLTLEGYNTHVFETGVTFMDKLKSANPDFIDLVIMDIKLPDADGIDLCKQIKSGTFTQDIPIVLMSAHANLPEVHAANCANDFIRKPFDIHYFMNKVRAQL